MVTYNHNLVQKLKTFPIPATSLDDLVERENDEVYLCRLG